VRVSWLARTAIVVAITGTRNEKTTTRAVPVRAQQED
jgi:hypothetical protein